MNIRPSDIPLLIKAINAFSSLHPSALPDVLPDQLKSYQNLAKGLPVKLRFNAASLTQFELIVILTACEISQDDPAFSRSEKKLLSRYASDVDAALSKIL